MPPRTSVPLCSISPLISAEACAADCASRRTSTATTAKPLPASPARAASTEALSARRLVWNAMSSISPMMLRDLARRGGDPLHRVVGEAHHLAALGRRLRHRLRLEARLRGAAGVVDHRRGQLLHRRRGLLDRLALLAWCARRDRRRPREFRRSRSSATREAPRSAVTVAVSVSPTLLMSSRSCTERALELARACAASGRHWRAPRAHVRSRRDCARPSRRDC